MTTPIHECDNPSCKERDRRISKLITSLRKAVASGTIHEGGASYKTLPAFMMSVALREFEEKSK